MPATTLDPVTALLVLDLQKGFASLSTVPSFDDVVRHAGRLADAFRSHGLPVVLVNVDGAAPGRTQLGRRSFERPAGWTDIVPELNPQPGDHLVTKQRWGAFSGTGLEEYLRTRGATQVVITGVSTTSAVEQTARHAYELGFNVTLAIDAMADLSAEAHANSIDRIFPKLGETATTAEIVDLLGKRGS